VPASRTAGPKGPPRTRRTVGVNTDQLHEHHAAVWAGRRPRRLSRPSAQQAAALAYRRCPPQLDRDPGQRRGMPASSRRLAGL